MRKVSYNPRKYAYTSLVAPLQSSFWGTNGKRYASTDGGETWTTDDEPDTLILPLLDPDEPDDWEPDDDEYDDDDPDDEYDEYPEVIDVGEDDDIPF